MARIETNINRVVLELELHSSKISYSGECNIYDIDIYVVDKVSAKPKIVHGKRWDLIFNKLPFSAYERLTDDALEEKEEGKRRWW